MGCGASKRYEPDKEWTVTVARRATEVDSKTSREDQHRSKKEKKAQEKAAAEAAAAAAPTVTTDAVNEALAAVQPEGFRDSLGTTGHGRMTVAMADMGIKDAASLLQQEEAFSAALGLKTLERQRLRKQLGRKDDKVELEPLEPPRRPTKEQAAPAAPEAPAAGQWTPAASEGDVPEAVASGEASLACDSLPIIKVTSSVTPQTPPSRGGSMQSTGSLSSSETYASTAGVVHHWLPAGVSDALCEAQLDFLSDNAASWCQQTGAIYLIEVRQNIDHFANFLCLSEEECDRLCNSLKIKNGRASVSGQISDSMRNSMSMTSSPTDSSSRPVQRFKSTVSRSSTNSTECLIELLADFDPTGSGLVKSEDLKQWLATLGMELSDKEADEMIKMASPNADGMVEYAKFVRELLSSPSPTARRMTRQLSMGDSAAAADLS